ncbi:MAG: hypothetical protein EXS68_02015 [Candidatus Ryanbacteria bacterium]|nr:hypothetical protein [Candidatus Ryanbacteria bacterium]
MKTKGLATNGARARLAKYAPPQSCARLPDEDYRAIRFYRHPNVRVLDDVAHDKIEIEKGVIVIMCSDGDRFLGGLLSIAGLFATKHRWTTRIASWMKRTSLLFIWAFLYIYPRLHMMSWHAGAHRLVKNSRTNLPGRATDKDLMAEIMAAIELKQIYQIVILDHCKCGKLAKHEFTVEEQFHDIVTARDRILAEYEKVRTAEAARLATNGDMEAAANVPKLKVICMCQVDYGKRPGWWWRRRLRTYHFSTKQLVAVDAAKVDGKRHPKIADVIAQYLAA